MRLRDNFDSKQWIVNTDDSLTESSGENYQNYVANNIKYIFINNSVFALDINGNERSIEIYPSTFPYIYAQANGKVLVVSNWGDAIVYDGYQWSRWAKEGDIYKHRKDASIVTEPRKVQFYSSIVFEGETLLGEWPTGRIYSFDGEVLKPWDNQPPFVSSDPVGYEAQSMAIYCEDLLVGYWPTVEIWKFYKNSKKWSLVMNLFSSPRSKSFIPYMDRLPDSLNPAFFGRRVTALIPFGDSLYASTSNLNMWDKNISYLTILTNSESDEYGAVYKITSNRNCKTRYIGK